MRVAVVFRADFRDGNPVPCYAWSYVDALSAMGHEVWVAGEGHPCSDIGGFPTPDLLLEIENGRNDSGELRFQHAERRWPVQSAILLIDSHGHPDLHAEIAKKYHHVFFAVWSKRDLFAGHPSAHWCPNATDLKWFGTPEQLATEPTVDVGFFGSKRGLSRASELVAICKANGWTYDVRQVASNRNPERWPATGNAMARCRVLFNRGQKHDGPNQRVMESMAMGRPLVTDRDERDGMSKLFGPEHYLRYESRIDLIGSLRVALTNQAYAQGLIDCARREIESKHLIKHRAQQILETVNG